jgi:hypothetical protein
MSVTTNGDRKILSPCDKLECISLKEAADIAGRSESTMRNWCDEYGLGRRIGGGPWSVSKVALAMFLDGDVKALRAYHASVWTDPGVATYFERENLGDLIKSRQCSNGKLGTGPFSPV